MNKKMTYDTAMVELTGILRELEDETLSVDNLVMKVKRAKELVKYCREILLRTEEEVQEILDE